jgi:pimeloyl-ACP methyl ester carboxylesterase
MTEPLELRVRDARFSARADGPVRGDLVLLLHGFPQTSYEWRHQLHALGDAGYRAVAPDQRGYARGARPDGVDAYRIDELVGDVLGMADALGARRFHLVGHDWGGAVAWFSGARHPDRVRSLAIVSTPHPVPFSASMRDGEQREKSGYMALLRSPEAEATFLDDDAALLRAHSAGSGLDEGAAAEYVRVLREPGALAGALNWYRANTFGEPMAPVTVPTLYVWSTDDVAIGREAAEATAAHVVGPYRFVELEGVSHWIPEAAPEVLSRYLVEHLAAAADT